ncbi:ParB/RepB/Spo0J family partition protein [Adlercreutzia equolifaciens]|uniref:ParB/RepB/Spo0J family partition protein n=1 Tax=Adlercreutzia equolifaciens TaxID=446660 RepID=UPI00266CAD96|nr:ParB/RepB/Spo0J family partition protein [Adlercreutzia equolifaciens]
MPRAREIPFNLPSVDELFTDQEERDDALREKVTDIPLSLIDPFPDHPFHVRDDDDMADLVTSVASVGILTPLTVRPKEDGRYELVSGHRRKRAAERAGLSEVPAVVRQMTRDEAIVAMVDANMQRERILPSEKAFSYKMKLEALKRQGHRTDLTCVPSEHKLRGTKARDLVARESGESASQIRRYIRLTELLPELLDMVDEGSIGMRPAVEISYLSKPEQLSLYRAIEEQVSTPSHAQAIRMRRCAEEGALTPALIRSIMEESKPNQTAHFRMPRSKIARFFKPDASRETIEERIVRGLELLERQERKRGLDR